MAKIIASATLAATVMPLLSRHVRQPVLVGKHDINFSRHIDQNPKDEGNDTTVPSLLFGENILPSTSGYKSVAFLDFAGPLAGDEEIILVSPAASSGIGEEAFIYLLSYSPSLTTFYHHVGYLDVNGSLTWDPTVRTDVIAIDPATWQPATIAMLKGKIYVGVSIVDSFLRVYSPSSLGSTASVALVGLASERVIGLCASSGYLILWGKKKVHWSSLEDPTDFVPSDVTGAGATEIVDLLGDIRFCKATQNGFIIYGDLNCVYAQASNDFRFPFIFKAIPGLVGVEDLNDVSYGLSHDHLVKSGSAIYKVSKAQAAPVFQDFHTFLSAKKGEQFIDATKKLEEYSLDNTEAMFTVIDGSTSTLSYKSSTATQYDRAIVDISALGRQGKVKVDHQFVIMWPFDAVSVPFLVKHFDTDLITDLDMTTIADLGDAGLSTEGINLVCFVAADGTFRLMIDASDYPAEGTIILGPFQLAREAMAELTRVEATVANVASTECTVITSITGEQQDLVTSLLTPTQLGKKVRYNSRVTGLNHSICIQGTFDLSSVLLELVPRAKR